MYLMYIISDDVGGDGSDVSPHRGQMTTIPYPTVFLHYTENRSDGGTCYFGPR